MLAQRMGYRHISLYDIPVSHVARDPALRPFRGLVKNRKMYDKGAPVSFAATNLDLDPRKAVPGFAKMSPQRQKREIGMFNTIQKRFGNRIVLTMPDAAFRAYAGPRVGNLPRGLVGRELRAIFNWHELQEGRVNHLQNIRNVKPRIFSGHIDPRILSLEGTAVAGLSKPARKFMQSIRNLELNVLHPSYRSGAYLKGPQNRVVSGVFGKRKPSVISETTIPMDSAKGREIAAFFKKKPKVISKPTVSTLGQRKAVRP